jgi:hypothetical protein
LIGFDWKEQFVEVSAYGAPDPKRPAPNFPTEPTDWPIGPEWSDELLDELEPDEVLSPIMITPGARGSALASACLLQTLEW